MPEEEGRPQIVADAVVLGAGPLDLASVARVARDRVAVLLADETRHRLQAARTVVERAAREERAVYGVTTGLGASKDVRLPADDRADFQRRAVMGRSVAVGEPLPTDVVRAIVFARAAAMARGGSGVSPAVLDTLVSMLNAGVHPIVPRWGSIGAADLGLLAAMALPVIGAGEAEVRGERLAAAEALQRAGLAPVTLGPKDGLALVSANAASVGHGALVLWDAQHALEAESIATAVAMEGFCASLSPLDPRAQAARPAPGQVDAARRLATLLEGSALWDEGAARSFQDPISFRCASQIAGAARSATGYAGDCVEIELNSAGDNPLVLAESDAIVHNGNFHAAALAQAFDLVAIALAHVASAAAERTIKLLSPPHSALPLNLTPHGGTRTGFATVQKTVTALVAEMRHLANPGSLDFLPVSEGVEDHAPNAPFTVQKAAQAVDRLGYVAAIELLVAAQAVDLRPLAPMGRGARAAWEAVRAVVPVLDDDRPLGPDVERLRTLVVDGTLLRAVAHRA